MAQIQSGVTTDLVTIDPTFKTMRTVNKPDEMVGAFQWGGYTGQIAAATAAAAPIFSFRYAPGTSNLCVIKRVTIGIIQAVGYAATQIVGANMIVARSFSASDSGGTAVTITGNSNKFRSSFTASGVTDVRTATTGTLTAGARTLDTNPIGGVQAWALTTAGGLILPPTNIMLQQSASDYPLVLATNEGFIITNSVLTGTTGTIIFTINVEWFETSAF
jgi:hypothetical protein